MATRTQRSDLAAAGRAFFRQLASHGATAPVYVVTGSERYLVHEALRRITDAVFPGGPDDFNACTLHGSEARGVDIVTAASQVPMMAARRLVIVRGFERLAADDVAAVASYVERAFDTTVLVLEASKLDGRLKAVKQLLAAPNVEAVEFIDLEPRDAVVWVQRRAGVRSLTLERDVAEYLVDALGPNLQQLDLALDRVDLYCGDRRSVTMDDAVTLVPDSRARTVFELADHLAGRRLAEAAACFERLMDQGETPIGAVAMIAYQFRQILYARDGMQRGLVGRELESWVGGPPFRVRDIVATARAFDEPLLRNVVQWIAETDHALKSSRVRRELLVERLIMRICVRDAG